MKIILIGAMGVGKTTVARELSKSLDIEHIDIDEMRWEFFRTQKDYDDEVVKEFYKHGNELKAFEYFKPFEARFAIYILEKYQSGVIDFGAGYTVYKDSRLFEIIENAFSIYRNIFLLRYCKDQKESLEALKGRHKEIPDNLYYKLNTEFINSKCNEILAKHIIDTKDLSIEEIVNKIILNIA